ncbi:Mitogen-activated protein kinase kinase kinase 7 [Geodia barretti]|uniref:Mitogen-activated protein kinase kinase kinase 7 n=1 Tax=Geodia barretti TaxID=519541 RepID=A0AA35TKZ2_GEOBA|nr:Mitogen-activated protein kinase kinase kinase 7 [Geodia barretti]
MAGRAEAGGRGGKGRERGERTGSVLLEDIPHISPHELTWCEGAEVERGSFGDVRKARWRGNDVAVKQFIVADKKGGISEEIAGFSMVHGHPHIIRFYGAHIIPISLDDRPFIVMEFAPFSLGKVLHERRDLTYTVDHVMNWSLQMVMALEFVHKKEVLHRDIKPSNILLFENGRVLKLCNFATACKLEHTLTNAVGTALYMAPEVIKDEEARQYIEEAMKQGYVNVTLVKVIVEGPAGVGKTSVIYLLLGIPPPKDRHSTGCAERAIRVIRVGKEGEKWSEIPAKEFQEMIAEAVPILYEDLKAKGKGMEELDKVLSSLKEGQRGEQGEGEGGGGGRGEGGGGGGEGKEEKGGWEEEKAVKGKKRRVLVEKRRVMKDEAANVEKKDGTAVIDSVIQKLTQLVGGGKSSRRLLDMDLIYLTDTGGQQPFWDLIPIFASDTSATLFVLRLCEKLDEHPRNDLYQRGKQVGPSQRATLTTAEAFKTMLRGLHEVEGKSSKIIAVGTHRDLADDCEETLEEKNKKFAAIASPHFEKNVVFRNDGMQEIVFPVNAKTPDEDDEKEARKIRASIEQGATQHKIPIWWFILQMILERLAHNHGRDVLSKDACVHISDTLGFAEGELDAALAFFDKLNIFLYKKSILPRVVFTNPQVPMGNLSRLVEKQYHLKAAEADPTKATCVAMGGQWKNFRDCGILTLECLKEFKDHYVDGIFTPADFLTLLQNLFVVSKLSANEYFFPAILSKTTETKINVCLMSSRTTKIAPLAVEFPTVWAPPGVYCCSVCHLQSHSGWKVVKKPPIKPRRRSSNASPAQHHSISRNCIEFTKVGRPGSVTFIDRFSSFAVCVNIDTSKMEREDLAQHCQAIKTEIFAAVDAALENTHHKDTHPTSAFFCPRQDASCSTQLHVAHLSSNGKQWICSANSGVFDYLTLDQTLWLSGTGRYTYIMYSYGERSSLYTLKY